MATYRNTWVPNTAVAHLKNFRRVGTRIFRIERGNPIFHLKPEEFKAKYGDVSIMSALMENPCPSGKLVYIRATVREEVDFLKKEAKLKKIVKQRKEQDAKGKLQSALRKVQQGAKMVHAGLITLRRYGILHISDELFPNGISSYGLRFEGRDGKPFPKERI